MSRIIGREAVEMGLGARARGRKLFVVAMLAVAALLLFTGCGVGSVSTPPKPTATPTAQQILTSAKNAHLTDETFTVTVQGTANGTTISVTGTGKATVNPARVSMSLSTQVNGTTVALDEVIDAATGASYTRITSPASLATGSWVKSSDSSSPIAATDLQASAIYGNITDAKLIGSEQVNNVNTWHVQGTIAKSGSNGTIDVYVRTSDYLPVKMVIHGTGDAAIDVTVLYTAVNSGITIDLPAVN